MSSKDSTNSSMIASDYKEPHELPSLPAGLSADSLLVSALTEGTRKSSMRDLSASRFAGGGDTSGLPRSPTKSVVINLPEEPPSKRMRTHTNAAPIDAVVSGMCLSFSITYRANHLYRERMMMSMTRARPSQRISCLKNAQTCCGDPPQFSCYIDITNRMCIIFFSPTRIFFAFAFAFRHQCQRQSSGPNQRHPSGTAILRSRYPAHA